MKIPCSAASLLALSWAPPAQCSLSTLQDSPRAIPCLARHRGHAPARGQGHSLMGMLQGQDHSVMGMQQGQDHSVMGMQQGQPWRLPLAIPAVITWQPRANFPIDHVWRVGEKNNLPHGSSNSSEPSFQRQNWKQDHSLLLPQELSFPKSLSAVVRPCPDCPTTCGWGSGPFCTSPDTFR